MCKQWKDVMLGRIWRNPRTLCVYKRCNIFQCDPSPCSHLPVFGFPSPCGGPSVQIILPTMLPFPKVDLHMVFITRTSYSNSSFYFNNPSINFSRFFWSLDGMSRQISIPCCCPSAQNGPIFQLVTNHRADALFTLDSFLWCDLCPKFPHNTVQNFTRSLQAAARSNRHQSYFGELEPE